MENRKLLDYLTKKRLILCSYDFGSFGAGEMYHYYEDPIDYFDLYYGNLKISTQQQLYAWTCKLLYLNQGLEEDDFTTIIIDVSNAEMGLCVRSFSEHTAGRIASKVYHLKHIGSLYASSGNRKRRLVFNPALPITKEQKMDIVSDLFGFKKVATSEKIILAIEEITSRCDLISNKSIADFIGVSEYTISRNMNGELKDLIKEQNRIMKDEELFNKAIDVLGHMDMVSVRELQKILNTRNVPILKQAIDAALIDGNVKLREKGKNK